MHRHGAWSQGSHYVKNTGSQGSANGFGQRRRSGAKVRPAGRSGGRSVFNTPLFFTRDEGSLQVRRLTRNGLAPRLQDSTVGRHKAGELADRRKPRHAKDGVAMPLRSERFKVQARRLPAELGQHALVAAARGGDRKLKGIALLTRVTGSATASASGTGVAHMAGDSPSGYSLTGQSGLVFDVARFWRRATRAVPAIPGPLRGQRAHIAAM